ncbi:hypothetical protein SAMN05443247_06580 [Bradyrhizobium erythrophlei]|nr:hypothetical protein SAMN05443247_06580 [Bradyrhizobium erythrophlei]
MASKYQIVVPNVSVLLVEERATIPFDEDNRDYREYLAWLDAGGVPDPPTPQVSPSLDTVSTGQTAVQILGAT